MLPETFHNLYPVSSAQFAELLGPVLQRSVGARVLPMVPGQPLCARSERAGRYGVHLRYEFRAVDTEGGCQVQLQLHAEPSTTSVVVLLLCVLVFWPVALVLAWVAYEEQKRELRPAALAALWPALAQATHALQS